MATFCRKDQSDRETNTVADRKKKTMGGAALVATQSPQGEQPEFHAKESAVTKQYTIPYKTIQYNTTQYNTLQ